MAPSDVLKYVVVDELVHSEEPKHSKAFWPFTWISGEHGLVERKSDEIGFEER